MKLAPLALLTLASLPRTVLTAQEPARAPDPASVCSLARYLPRAALPPDLVNIVPDDSLDAPLARTSGPPLQYPVALREAGTEGWVIVGFVVTADGRATAVQVMASSDSAFAPAARATVEGSQYHPPRRGGQAVAAFSCQPVEFHLMKR